MWRWDGVVTVECEGRPHTIRCDRSELVLYDHDPDAEQVLAALARAASMPACVEIALAWRACLSSARLQSELGFWQAATGTPAFDDASAPDRRSSGLRSMPPRLRWALALAVADGPPLVFSDDPVPSRYEAILTRSSPAAAVHAALARSLAGRLDLPAIDNWLRDGRVFQINREPYSLARTVPESAGARHSWSAVCSLSSERVALPRAEASFDGERIDASVGLPAWWSSRVLAQGVCREQLVLDVTRRSPDGELLVVAGSWEELDGSWRLLPRPAAMTWDDVAGWTTRWSAAAS